MGEKIVGFISRFRASLATVVSAVVVLSGVVAFFMGKEFTEGMGRLLDGCLIFLFGVYNPRKDDA